MIFDKITLGFDFFLLWIELLLEASHQVNNNISNQISFYKLSISLESIMHCHFYPSH
jgi:hypothetical protein